jgi:general secretion pathway protein G
MFAALRWSKSWSSSSSSAFAALVVPRVLKALDERESSRRKRHRRDGPATQTLSPDNGRYPTGDRAWAPWDCRCSRPYRQEAQWLPGRLPKDPWGNNYQYINPGLRGEYDVFSFGADGAPGGTGFDADIGSWDL